jgi:TRAP-type C4-dicarboxylate transport system permease small subunit
VPDTADYLHFMMRERTPVLDWPYGVVYSVFLAAAVMVVLRCLAAIVRPEASDKA